MNFLCYCYYIVYSRVPQELRPQKKRKVVKKSKVSSQAVQKAIQELEKKEVCYLLNSEHELYLLCLTPSLAVLL